MGRGRYIQFLVHRYSGFLHRTRSARRTEGSIAFSAAPGRSGRGPGVPSGAYTAVNCLYSSALIALSLLSGLWPLSRVPLRGPFPACLASILSGLHFAGILPSFFARAFVILFPA